MIRPAFRLSHVALLQVVMHSPTLTEAARRLHVSQPAVSKQLKQLQEDLGFVLFERKGHQLIPTFEARALLDQVARVNASLDVLNRLASEFRVARRGHLQIGCISSVAIHLLPKALKATLEAKSQMLCTVHTGNSAQVVEWVETQQIDAAIALKVRNADSFAYTPLLQMRLECLLPSTHPLAQRRSLTPLDLAPYPVIGIDLPHIVLPDPETPAWDDGLGSVHLRVDSAQVACSMAEAGLGIAVADSMTVAACASKSLVRRSLEHPYKTEIGIYRPSYRPQIKMVDELIIALKTQAFNLTPLSSRKKQEVSPQGIST